MTPPRHVEDAAPYKDGPKSPHTRSPSGQHPLTLPPPRRGRACPARNLAAACRHSFRCPPIPPNHLTPQPAPFTHHPHNLCPPTAITPIYTLPKLYPQTLSKKSKKLPKVNTQTDNSAKYTRTVAEIGQSSGENCATCTTRIDR